MKHKHETKSVSSLSAAISGFFPALGRQRIKSLIQDKNVKVDGKRVCADIQLRAGQTLEVFVPAEFEKGSEISVVYWDKAIVIADKPPHTDSVTALPAALKPRFGMLFPAHRLDTNTTGLVVLAKSPDALAALTKAFKRRLISKKYIATIVGRLPQKKGTLRHWLLKDEKSGRVLASDSPSDSAQEAITDYEEISFASGLSVVALYPLTGRTHQLRVQLARISCPILGDGKYGDFAENRKSGASVQALRAVGIRFGSMPPPLEYLSGKEFEIT